MDDKNQSDEVIFLSRDVHISGRIKQKLANPQFLKQVTKLQDQDDWLKIYCSLLASTEQGEPEHFVEITDQFFDEYKKRWTI